MEHTIINGVKVVSNELKKAMHEMMDILVFYTEKMRKGMTLEVVYYEEYVELSFY